MSLIAGVSVLFTNSQTVYKTQRSLGYMMEDGRYVLETLSKELRRTGFLRNKFANGGLPSDIFKADPATTIIVGSPSSGITIPMLVNEYVGGTTGESVSGVSGNVFAIRYQLNDKTDTAPNSSSDTLPNNTSSPCSQYLGLLTTGSPLISTEDPAIENHVVTLYFYVANDNGIPTLYCKAKRDVISATATTVTVTCKAAYGSCTNPTALPIIANVERLIVKYGIDSDPIVPTVPRAANYYVDAATVGTANWSNVVAIKLFVVLRSEDDNISKKDDKDGKFSIEGVSCSASTYPCPATKNRRLYRVFSTTIAFRNEIL
jgi:hypothetical protein